MSVTQTISILGASGNVGKLLVEELSKQQVKIRAFGRSKPKFDLPNVTNESVDYESVESITNALQGSDVTHILVGLPYKTSLWETEWPPLLDRILEAAVKTKTKLIFFDNVYAYGHVKGKMTEETPMNPISRKGKVRQLLDEKVLASMNTKDLKAIIAKAADFYGPNIETSVIGDRFFNQVITANTVEWFGNPAKHHTYTYVPDIIKALVHLSQSEYTGVIHLPTATPPLDGQAMKTILEQVSGKSLKLSPLRPVTLFFLQFFMPVLGEFREMMYQYEEDYYFDSSRFVSLFPDFNVTPYEEGIKETYTWYLQNSKAK